MTITNYEDHKKTLNAKCPHLLKSKYCDICSRKVKSCLVIHDEDDEWKHSISNYILIILNKKYCLLPCTALFQVFSLIKFKK